MREHVDDLRAVLNKKRAELVGSIRLQSSQLNIGEGERDLIDQVQGITRREEAVTLLHALHRTLAAVDAALLAMEEGSYGDCAECGDEISSKRLAAIPWASNCIRCQEALDSRTYRSLVIPDWDQAA